MGQNLTNAPPVRELDFVWFDDHLGRLLALSVNLREKAHARA